MLLATIVMAVLASYREFVADGSMTPSEWVLVVVAVFTTFTVWATANITGFEKAKTLVAAAGLVLNLLVAFIVAGITTDEWMLLALQFLGALGVAGAPAPKQVVERTVIAA